MTGNWLRGVKTTFDKKPRGFLAVCLFFAIGIVSCQTPDVFRAEYMAMPKNSREVKTTRLKLLANVPIKVLKKDIFVLGAEYNGYDFQVPAQAFGDLGEISEFQVIDVNFAYVLKYDDAWRIVGVVTPRWASNFTNGIQREDFNVNYTVGAFKDKKDVDKPFRLVLGIAYNASSPVAIPLPVVYYEKRFRHNWSYTLGVPKMGLKYFTKKDHFFQTEVIVDGYYVNIQNDILLSDRALSTDVSSTAVLSTFGYQYKFTKDISAYVMAGYTLYQSGVLRDGDRLNVFTLNDGYGWYFRTGFRIGI